MDDLHHAVKSGEVRPADQLFDAGTGLWAPAWKVPVYRFIVEELELDDELPDGLLEEMEVADADLGTGAGAVEGDGGPADPRPLDEPESAAQDSESAYDPFDLSFELVDTDPLGREESLPLDAPRSKEDRGFKRDEGPPPEGTEADEEKDAGLDRGLRAGSPEDAGAAESDDFGLQLGSGFSEKWGEEWGDVGEARAGSSTPEKGRSPPAEPRRDQDPAENRDTRASSPAERGSSPAEEDRRAHGDGAPRAADHEDEPARWTPDSPEDLEGAGQGRPRGPERPRLLLPLLLLLLVGAGLVGVGWFVLSPSGDGTEPSTWAEELAVVARPELSPPPDDLQDWLPPALDGIERRFQAVTDSLRADLTLADAPPRDWLSGFYLANAGQLPSVPEFWERYAEFLDAMEARDRSTYMEGVREGLDEAAIEPDARDRLLAYMQERYASLAAYRAHRYESLSLAASAAVELHQVLARHEDVISHAPVEGSGVSADPILEARIPPGAVQAEVERSLDRVFRALDRSRGGGVPSGDGLRSELFLRFGEG